MRAFRWLTAYERDSQTFAVITAIVPMRDSETFQGELGRIAAELRSARAFLEVQATSHWRHALAGTLKDHALYIQATQTAILLATTCVRAVDACFALGGSSALYGPHRCNDGCATSTSLHNTTMYSNDTK